MHRAARRAIAAGGGEPTALASVAAVLADFDGARGAAVGEQLAAISLAMIQENSQTLDFLDMVDLIPCAHAVNIPAHRILHPTWSI